MISIIPENIDLNFFEKSEIRKSFYNDLDIMTMLQKGGNPYRVHIICDRLSIYRTLRDSFFGSNILFLCPDI
jgi:hypothetical protein